MPHLNTLPKFTVVLCAAVLTATPHAWANSVPFTETFTDGFDGDSFIDESNTFTVNDTTDRLEVTLTSDIRSYSVVETSGIVDAVDTVVTTSVDFTLDDADRNATRVGFVLFGVSSSIEDPDFTEAYVASVREPGGFDTPDFQLIDNLTGVGPSGDLFTTLTDGLTSGEFNLTAVSTILDGSLEVDIIVTDLGNPSVTESVTYSVATSTLPTGDFFGLYVDSFDETLSTPTFSFDNFSVTSTAIPEPTSGLLITAGLGLLARRRANQRA